jgi:Ulp1 family protease
MYVKDIKTLYKKNYKINMEKREIRTLFTESTFTNLCKSGFLFHNGTEGKVQVNFTNEDIKTLINGKILEKELQDVYLKFALQDIGFEMIREILRRSPVYSNLSYEI